MIHCKDCKFWYDDGCNHPLFETSGDIDPTPSLNGIVVGCGSDDDSGSFCVIRTGAMFGCVLGVAKAKETNT